jgi:tRNA pseudouridine38-40 synthase
MAIRIKAIISYDGSNFDGYQVQPNKRTVQGELQRVLAIINNCDIKVAASGRTDAKVHALNQVIHFDSIKEIELRKYRFALNNYLPKDIYIKTLTVVDESFHARFLVKKKHYRYLLNMGEYNTFRVNYEYQYGKKLDVDLMKKATLLFLGEHDFHNFTSTKEEETKDYIRSIETFSIMQKDDILIFDVIGDGFLRYMVRMMVGTLIKIGENMKDEREIVSRLDNINNVPCPFKAPGEGLYLVEVYY